MMKKQRTGFGFNFSGFYALKGVGTEIGRMSIGGRRRWGEACGRFGLVGGWRDDRQFHKKNFEV